jgi:hypothetical protein
VARGLPPPMYANRVLLAVDNDAISKSDANSVGDSSERKSLSSPEKKIFFHQRKPFLPKVKERKVASSASAFSPENESSVYAFESEAEAPVSTPFRRKAKEAAAKDNHGSLTHQYYTLAATAAASGTSFLRNLRKPHANPTQTPRKLHTNPTQTPHQPHTIPVIHLPHVPSLLEPLPPPTTTPETYTATLRASSSSCSCILHLSALLLWTMTLHQCLFFLFFFIPLSPPT